MRMLVGCLRNRGPDAECVEDAMPRRRAEGTGEWRGCVKVKAG